MNGATEIRERSLVSVVIPTHNRAEFLQEAVVSVLAQEGVGVEFDMELVVVDDASSDETPEVMKKFANVRYIRLETNRGEGGARNVGIKASRGKYIAFLDDDDLMLPHRLRLQVPAMDAHPHVGVVYSQNVMRGKGIDKIWEDVEPTSLPDVFDKLWPDAQAAPSGDLFEIFLKREFISMDTLLVRREAFEKAGYFEDYPTEAHYDMFLRLAFHVPFLFVEGNVAINRVNPAGVFHARLAGEEGYGKFLPKVIDRALELLPDSRHSRQLKREVHLALVPRLICMLERLPEVEQKQSYFRIVLQACPWILVEPPTRASIVKYAAFFTRGSVAPIASVEAICQEIGHALTWRGVKGWLKTRLFLGEIWKQVAFTLGSNRFPRHQAATYAAIRAFLYNPLTLQPTFLKFAIHAIFGARVYRFLADLKRKALVSNAQ